MLVQVKLFGDLRKHAKGEETQVEVDVSEGTTVGELVEQLGLKEGEAWTAAVNGEVVYAEDKLPDGASLIVFPPIAGG